MISVSQQRRYKSHNKHGMQMSCPLVVVNGTNHLNKSESPGRNSSPSEFNLLKQKTGVVRPFERFSSGFSSAIGWFFLEFSVFSVCASAYVLIKLNYFHFCGVLFGIFFLFGIQQE